MRIDAGVDVKHLAQHLEIRAQMPHLSELSFPSFFSSYPYLGTK